jgi:hypothetical protein
VAEAKYHVVPLKRRKKMGANSWTGTPGSGLVEVVVVHLDKSIIISRMRSLLLQDFPPEEVRKLSDEEVYELASS